MIGYNDTYRIDQAVLINPAERIGWLLVAGYKSLVDGDVDRLNTGSMIPCLNINIKRSNNKREPQRENFLIIHIESTLRFQDNQSRWRGIGNGYLMITGPYRCFPPSILGFDLNIICSRT